MLATILTIVCSGVLMLVCFAAADFGLSQGGCKSPGMAPPLPPGAPVPSSK